MSDQLDLIDTSETPAITWSAQQEAIFAWFAKDQPRLDSFTQYGVDVDGNLIVRARAGTGKSTTIIAGITRAPEQKILLCAFNKKIAVHLTNELTKLGSSARAETSHAIGYEAVRNFREHLTVVTHGERADALTKAVCGTTTPDSIMRLVSKLHTLGRETAPHATRVGELTNLAITFECVPDESSARCMSCGRMRDVHTDHVYNGFDAEYVEEKALAAMALAADVETGGMIDFADMIFLPVRNNWLAKEYDLVVVDEAQDFTMAQLEIAQRVCHGRICVVGDDRQAIYGFRGADSESLDRLKKELHAGELGLTTTYRCGKNIVAEAQQYVPDFEAGPDNPDGEVLTCDRERLIIDASAGNFILSRVNAPLVSIAMKLLRSGKRTRIAGRDIGGGLKSLIRKLRGRSVPDLLMKISNWQTRELNRLNAQLTGATNGRKNTIMAKMDAVRDQAEMLTSLTDGARNVDEVIDRIDALFTDDGLGDAGVITCSSVHKAKGLEAEKVFVLADTLRNWNTEELNIAYVAITRAKETLVYVRDVLAVATTPRRVA